MKLDAARKVSASVKRARLLVVPEKLVTEGPALNSISS